MQTLFPAASDKSRAKRARIAIVIAYRRAHFQYNVHAAIADVGPFTFDRSLMDRDWAELKANDYDLDNMIWRRQEARRPSRLNPDRVHAALSPDNPEFAQLLRFGEVGVEVSPLLPPDFEPTGNLRANWPRLRPGYIEAYDVVNAGLAAGFHEPGIGIILEDAALLAIDQHCHISTSNWAPNKEKNPRPPNFQPQEAKLRLHKDGRRPSLGKGPPS
mmetsp:Transcript_11528/g.25609  ORF Transcript_11528/g.25609 Transcript_11528/m.25609 type:complete len:216 (+) Transcript_11528:2019-2666(+)